MYQIIICEDNPIHADYLRMLTEDCGEKYRIRACCQNVTQLKEILRREGMPDILLMDIELHEENGIEAVKHLISGKAPTQVVYVSGYTEYCTSVYSTDHVCFLRKPVGKEELRSALWSAAQRSDACRQLGLLLRNSSGTFFIRFNQIYYLESEGRKVRISMEYGEQSFYTRLDILQEKLDARFFRCHKSFLVNFDYVTEVTGRGFLLDNGVVIPISARHFVEAKNMFFQYLSDRLPFGQP